MMNSLVAHDETTPLQRNHDIDLEFLEDAPPWKKALLEKLLINLTTKFLAILAVEMHELEIEARELNPKSKGAVFNEIEAALNLEPHSLQLVWRKLGKLFEQFIVDGHDCGLMFTVWFFNQEITFNLMFSMSILKPWLSFIKRYWVQSQYTKDYDCPIISGQDGTICISSTYTQDEPAENSTFHLISTETPKNIETKTVMEFIERICSVPLHNAYYTKQWLTNLQLRLTKPQDLVFKRAVILLNNLHASKTIKQFETYYFDKWPLFKSHYTEYNKYYSKNMSIEIIVKLLMYQFDNSRELVKHFLTDLVNVLDKKLPKRNCLEVISSSGGGKSYFFDMVTDFFLNVGDISNFKSKSLNRFQNCPNRRVLLWDEPECDAADFDTVRMLFGGDHLTTKINSKTFATIVRTPCIVLSKKRVFPNTIAFNDRMFRYQWKKAPFLESFDKFPNPLFFTNILQYFDVDY